MFVTYRNGKRIVIPSLGSKFPWGPGEPNLVISNANFARIQIQNCLLSLVVWAARNHAMTAGRDTKFSVKYNFNHYNLKFLILTIME